MNNTIFLRLIWKEFRQVRAFAVCLLVIGAMIQLTLIALSTTNLHAFVRGIAMVFPLMFLAGCAATIFSYEHENKSYLRLRMLPVSLKQIFSAKLTLTIATTLLITFALWLIAMIAGERFMIFDIAVYALIMTEMLVWGTFFSMLDRHPMRAIALTVITVFGIGIVCSLVSILLQGASMASFGVDWLSVLFRILVISGVSWLTVRTSRAWYQDEQVTLPFSALVDPLGNFSRTHLSTKVSTGQFGSILRILWLQMRRNVVVMTILVVGALAFVYFRSVAHHSLYNREFQIASSIFGAAAGAISFAGLSSCRLLLLNRGVRPSKLWAVVTLFGIAFCLLFIAALLILTGYSKHINADYALLVLTSFFWGQLSVQTYRRQFAGIGMAIVVGVACYYWLSSMSKLDAPRLVYVYPIAILPILATLWGTNRWLKEIGHSRLFGLALFTGITALLTLSFCWRAYEIPKTDPTELSGLSSATIIEQPQYDPVTRNRFEELGDRLISLASEGEVPVEESKSIVSQMMQLDINYSLLLHIAAPDSPDFKRARRFSTELSRQLLLALNAQDIGFAEQILRYAVESDSKEVNFHAHAPTWAELPDNQAERIVSLIDLIDENDAKRFDRLRQEVSVQYWTTRRSIKLDNNVLEQKYGLGPNEAAAVRQFGKIAFWEQERSLRAMDRNAARTLEYISWFEENSNRPILQDEVVAWELVEAVRRRDAFSVEPLEFDLLNARFMALDMHRANSFLKIALAISAWRHDHAGELPAALDELTPRYLVQSPSAQTSSNTFYYFPDGIANFSATISGTIKEQDMAVTKLGIYNISLTDPFLMSVSSWRNDRFPPGDQPSDLSWTDVHSAEPYQLRFQVSKDEKEQ